MARSLRVLLLCDGHTSEQCSFILCNLVYHRQHGRHRNSGHEFFLELLEALRLPSLPDLSFLLLIQSQAVDTFNSHHGSCTDKQQSASQHEHCSSRLSLLDVSREEQAASANFLERCWTINAGIFSCIHSSKSEQ